MQAYFEKEGKCQLCQQAAPEQKLVLSSLAKNIKKIALTTSFSGCPLQNPDQQFEGLARLLNTLRHNHALLPHHPPCLHLKWLKYLKKYLGCSLEQVDYLCHLTAYKLAERSYHFFLMQTQIKNASHTAQHILPQQSASRQTDLPTLRKEKQQAKGIGWEDQTTRGTRKQSLSKREQMDATLTTLKDFPLSKNKQKVGRKTINNRNNTTED